MRRSAASVIGCAGKTGYPLSRPARSAVSNTPNGTRSGKGQAISKSYSISNRAEFEALVKKNLAMQQTDQTKKQQKRIPQITTRLEQSDKVLNKLYEDNALGTIPQDRYEQMSQKY